MYTEYIKKAAEYFYANDQPNRGSMMDDAAREVERLRKIEAAAVEAFDNCVLYDDKCHICTNTYSYEFSKEHAPDCKLKKLEEALGE